MIDIDSDESSPSENDFHCSCCYELMVDATTLNCGHSFCRFCLAQWWHSSKKTTCPECRQQWSGFPSTNILLRKTIKKLFPNELAERRASLEAQHKYQKIIDKFESFGKKQSGQNQRGSQGQQNRLISVTKTVAVVAGILGVLMFFYDLFGVLFSSNELLVRKPIEAWSPSDVSTWVSGLGPWSKEINESTFQEMGINGKILKSLTESDLEDMLGIEKPYQRHALLSEIDHVKILGVKPPTDLWEYKAVFPARSMFLLWGFRDFPRATALYTFIALHDEVFMPLLYYTSQHLQDINSNQDLTYGEWHLPVIEYVRFAVRVLLTPYYLMGKFAFQWVGVNPWTVGFILMFCTLMTAAEILRSRWLVLGGWRKLPITIWNNTKGALLNGAFHLVIWHFIPTFICDIVFYWMLFVGPLYAWNSLKDSFTSRQLLSQGPDENVPLNIVRLFFSWVWRKIIMIFGSRR